MYSVRFDKAAERRFAKLDPSVQRLITAWLAKHIDHSDDPRRYGKALVGNLAGLWRYRIGQYRVIVDIRDQVAIVLVIRADKREVIYRT